MSITSPSSLTICHQDLPSGIHFNMIEVEGGLFTMGDDEGNYEIWEPKPMHKVKLDTFYLGQFPVSQFVWEKVMGENPSRFLSEDRPVERASWYDALEFCNRLSEMQNLAPVYEIDRTQKDPKNQSDSDDLKWLVTIKENANGYRLPTEAQWEYAARGGIHSKTYPYAGGEDLERMGWYRKNSRDETQPAGMLLPNELGIYEMSGNVREWCEDRYASNYYEECHRMGVVTNPLGSQSGSFRVLRGGSAGRPGSDCRLTHRYVNYPHVRRYGYGFRLARIAL